MQTRYQLPDILSGYPLDPERERLWLIVPEATTNLVTNPSFEVDLTGWSGTNTARTRVTNRAYAGQASMSITRNAGADSNAQWTAATATAGQTFTASAWIYTEFALPASFNPIALRWYTGGGATITTTTGAPAAIGSHRWQRITVTGTAPATTATVRVQFTMTPLPTGVIVFVDAVQLEQKLYATTYADGDQRGLLPQETPAPYAWLGTPHNSASLRRPTTRAGGREVNLRDYGLLIVGIVGADGSPRNVISIPNALGGASYQRTIPTQREITLAGRISGDRQAVARSKAALLRDLDAQRSGIDQPCVLIVEAVDDCGVPIGARGRMVLAYAGGLEGNEVSPWAENVAIRFVQDGLGIVQDGAESATITAWSTIATNGQTARRNADGTWSVFGTLSGYVYDLIANSETDIYAAFGAASPYIQRWNGTSWINLGTGLNDEAYALARETTNNILVGGLFTTAGGGAANRIARWNVSTLAWSALGTGVSGGSSPFIAAIAAIATNNIYVGGTFTTPASNVARWNGASWAALAGGGVNGRVNAIAVDPADGTILFGGVFTTAGGGAANRVARYNPTGPTWSALGSGIASDVTSLAFLPDGSLVAGWSGGVSRWNGSTWQLLGVNGPLSITHLVVSPDGWLYAHQNGGQRIMQWDGVSWVIAPVALVNNPLPIFGFARNQRFTPSNQLIIIGAHNAPSSSSTIAANPAITSTNRGSPTRTYTITLTRTGAGNVSLPAITLTTTQQQLQFASYTTAASEVITITVDQGAMTVTSSINGNITGQALLAQSQAFTLPIGEFEIAIQSTSFTGILTYATQHDTIAGLFGSVQ